ncbi:polysaccharide deacetylase family protein [Acidiferrimicrobium sp. IK]|uniref:polysaccharide deacetylase family protein n=1 Tax=Acidiferrimicrobium sp. IK TaxID=2871700 RepID=UPI0021CB737A|nr:polysaccharide deacetylase family protein [Acidiferrimicrobium sp. IK]MCU4186177.1 polysaccharide deacetylase family protein [Acidiferrimicrobium sp. IK]
MTVPILMYHDIVDGPEVRDEFEVPLARFCEHLDALAAAGWKTAPLSSLRTTGADARTVFLTFDDGFTSFGKMAVPALSARGFHATVFVPSGWVGKPAAWVETGGATPTVMSWPQLRGLDPDQVEVGGHGHSHVALDRLTDDELRAELTGGRRVLAEGIGRPPTLLAYPFGYHTAKVRRAAAEAGYSDACEVGYGLQPSPGARRYALRRLIVRPGMDGPALVRVLEEGQRGQLRQAVGSLLRPAWRVVRQWREPPVRLVPLPSGPDLSR